MVQIQMQMMVCTINPLLSTPGGLFILSTFLGGGGGAFLILSELTKRKKQARVVLPYSLFWTRAMTVALAMI